MIVSVIRLSRVESCEHVDPESVEHSTEKPGNDGEEVVVEEAEAGGGEAAEEVGSGGAALGGGHGLKVGPGGLLNEAVADGNFLAGVHGGGGGVHGGVGRRKHVSEGSVGGGKGGFKGYKFEACCALRRRGGEEEFGHRWGSDGVVAAEGRRL